MRLIVEYPITDHCTYSFTTTVPVEYESAEAFIVELERLCIEAKKVWDDAWPTSRSPTEIQIGGQTFDFDDFFESGHYYSPDVYTIDEWFAEVEMKDET
jgi:hypothetical protein